jgi:hypothetical protein
MGNCENFKSPSAFGLKICTSDITCVNGLNFSCVTLPSNPTLNDVLNALESEICSIIELIANMDTSVMRYVTDINPVVGNDTQWELVYSDATTTIIDSAYYLENQGTGEELVYNQAGHPTYIRSLDEQDTNSKIVVSTNSDRVLFDVKQYGRITNMFVELGDGLSSIATVNQARYRTSSDSMAFVIKSGGGPVIDNHVTQRADFHLSWIDAYHSKMFYHIVHDFRLTYNDLSYQNSLDKKFYFALPFSLSEGGVGFPVGFFNAANQSYFHGMHDTCIYDLYNTSEPSEDLDNKIRRYGVPDRVCNVAVQDSTGAAEPNWPTSATGNRLVFKYLVLNDLIDPAGGADITKNYTFEAIGSIMIHHDTNTDFMSTITHSEINH